MNEEIKIVALEALKTMPNVSRLDVVNILECVQKCYAQVEDVSIEERFLIDELQYFIKFSAYIFSSQIGLGPP